MRVYRFFWCCAAMLSLMPAAEVSSSEFVDEGPWLAEKEIFVSMRDGIHLSTDVLLPKGTQGRFPTVLFRTPYDKGTDEKWFELWIKQGYAVVVQNERGRLLSEGEYKNYLQGASTDGYDTVQWIANQPWSNGRVGAAGCSSPAEQEWPMAASNPPGLSAIIAAGSGTAVGDVPGNSTRGAFYRGGIPVYAMWALFYSSFVSSERLLLPPNSTREQRVRLRNGYMLKPKILLDTSDVPVLLHLPSADLLRKLGAPAAPWENYIRWSPGDPRWKQVEQLGAGAKPRVPALHVTSWYDIGVGESIRLFKYLQDISTPNQYLIVGPGPHCSMWTKELFSNLRVSDVKHLTDQGFDFAHMRETDLSSLSFGDLSVGDARYGGTDDGYAHLFLKWLDYWLKGEQNAIAQMPKVQLYVIGLGWIYGDEWPLKQSRPLVLYLDRPRAPLSPTDGGVLLEAVPTGHRADSYLYDPGSPVITRGDNCCGVVPLDQRPVESRKDVLVYTSPTLQRSVTIAGPIDAVLYISSTAKDTDFILKLIDVYPDGTAINLSEDGFRVRYRNGFDKKASIRPGQVYKIELSNMVAAVQFHKGHRIRVDITSSDFPFFERNLNTGGNNYDEFAGVIAKNSIHFGDRYPSRIILPELPE